MEGRIGFGPRFGALLIDAVVIIIGGIVLGGLLGGVLGGMMGGAAGAGLEVPDAGADAADAGAALGGAAGGIIGLILGAAAGMALMSIIWIIWEGLTGAALGKLLLGIKIKNVDGQPAPIGKLLGRAAVKYCNSWLTLLAGFTGIAILGTLGNIAGLVIFIGCFFALGASKQALHDMVAKTAVYKK